MQPMTSRGKLRCGAGNQQGVALLAVLWLSVALTLIAMTTAYLVRTEASAAGNHLEAEQAALLARGAVQAALYAMVRPAPDDAVGTMEAAPVPRFRAGQRWMYFPFPHGEAIVEVIPENAKINVNQASPQQLAALFTVLGVEATASLELAAAIADWRAPRASDVSTPLDLFYAQLPQPYPARHAPFEELEELLAVKGMSRDLFFGTLRRDSDGSWKRTPPLADLLTTEPALGGVNVMSAPYEVLLALPGWDEELARVVVAARERLSAATLLEAVPRLSAVVSTSAVLFSPGPAYTLTATARLRDSAVRRGVRARLRLDRNAAGGFQITAWWEDWPWSPPPATAWETAAGARL